MPRYSATHATAVIAAISRRRTRPGATGWRDEGALRDDHSGRRGERRPGDGGLDDRRAGTRGPRSRPRKAAERRATSLAGDGWMRVPPGRMVLSNFAA